MVVMDKEDYIRKSEELLHQPTYKELPTDPTTKHKNRLISLLKPSSQKGVEITSPTRGYILQGQDPPNTMGCSKYTKQVYLSGP